MRTLAIVLVAAAVSSAATVLVTRVDRGSATSAVSGCGQPAGARWLCARDGFYIPGIDWSCIADSAKLSARIPDTFACYKGGTARTPDIATVWFTRRRVLVNSSTRPSGTRSGGRYEYVFRVLR
jgi:hypothetical protein